MDKNIDYNNFYGYGGYPPQYMPPFEGFDNIPPESAIPNPVLQYEQGYMYYRYLTQQLEYKLKCKEYEKISSKENRAERRVE